MSTVYSYSTSVYIFSAVFFFLSFFTRENYRESSRSSRIRGFPRMTVIIDSSRALVTASSVNRRCVKSRRRRSVACLFGPLSSSLPYASRPRNAVRRESRVRVASLLVRSYGDPSSAAPPSDLPPSNGSRERDRPARNVISSAARVPKRDSDREGASGDSREQWRDRHAPRNRQRRRVHDVDDTSVLPGSSWRLWCLHVAREDPTG